MSLSQDTHLDLITPAEAVEQICERAGNKYQARVLIADAIHNGDVLVYANRVYEIEDALPTDDWADLIGIAKLWGENAEVAGDMWNDSYHWPEETRYWDWQRGNFILSSSSDLTIALDGLLFEGVSLERSAVLAITGQTTRSGAGGRRSDREKWADFWIAFFTKTRAEQTDFASFHTKTALSAFMLEASDEAFSAQAIKFAVDKVWMQFVEPNK